ncbi:hypothetical protein [Nocardiopsis sp. L17-MgMaSL7]|uniref:hypothetical protein n=1 Tax=Nocardiopsis sp. L17-MgMaSL7 TaxID=1938893 RepID=UPI0011B4C2DF|nr:hypothetical protein [Nocardiopsis sp. L17-MgMaSL7]
MALLQCATRLRAMEFARGIDTEVPWETVLAQIITWHHELPLGEGACDSEDALEICIAALASARLDNLEGTVRAGGYEVRRRGNAFRVRFRWDPAIEAADMHLEQAAHPTSLPELSSTEREWIRGRSRTSRELPPPEVLHAAAQRAQSAIDIHRQALPEGTLPDTFRLDEGLTVGHATAVLSVIMGLASLCESTAHILKRTETTLAHIHRDKLSEMVADQLPTVPSEHVEATIERLTFKKGRSCRASPLAEVQGNVIVCPPLITPRAVDTIILRSSAYDPNRYGPIGQRQGRRAEKWKDWLGEIPGVLVSERIRARRQDNRIAGDLDVVAVDPQQRRGVCLEVKWPIDAISLPEVIKIEDWVKSASAQANRLRTELTSGEATVQLPHGWPKFSDIDWTWAVATPQQLCLRPVPFDDIHVTSFRYMTGLDAPSSLDQVIDILISPDLPVENIDFHIGTREFMIGHQKVVLDVIELQDKIWKPYHRGISDSQNQTMAQAAPGPRLL